ncbi:MAG: LTA synthase family protein, partial [SAR324 cluster bacterium]|nr:LTA synthase family protein [SAR324 cluster bacterium]
LFHSIILGLYPFLAAYEFNRHEIPAFEFMSAVPWALLLIILFVTVLTFLFKSLLKASVFFSVSSLLLFAYGPFAKWLRADLNTPGSALVLLEFNQAEIFPFALLLLSLLASYIWIKQATELHVSNLAFFLNVLAASVLVVSVISIFAGLARESKIKVSHSALMNYSFKASPGSPDIYYIVLDGYGRNDLLKELYGYDNSPFTKELDNLGFFIADKAVANYHRTNYALAAALNGSYLEPPLIDAKNKQLMDFYLQNLIHENSLAMILKKAGYQTVAFESGYYTTELTESDIYYPVALQNRVLATAFSYIQFPYFRELVSLELHKLHRQRLSNIFPTAMNSSKASNSPSFIFLHVLAPHPPFVFNEDGSAFNSNKVFNLGDGDDYGGLPDYKERYIKQLQHISKLTLDFFKELLERNKNAIVILHADHGPGLHFDRESLEQTDIKERYSILSAFYFPSRNYQMLYESISPVNSVRVMLSTVSGNEVPLLQDRSFFSTSRKPFDLTEITNIIGR